MSRHTFSLGSLILLTLGTAKAQEQAPLLEGVAPQPLREHCWRLLKAVKAQGGPLPAVTVKALETLLARQATRPAADVAAIQELLDPHCLIRVTINPESRVKAARGAADAVLLRGRETFFLVKVHNEAGVTHALTVAGPQLRTADLTDAGRWLEAAVCTAPPLAKTLSGERVEYVLLRLTARASGKREATLTFDVGQGTQDLGFRAEVPILFAVREAKR